MKAALAWVMLAAPAAAAPQPGFEVRIPDKLEIAAGGSGSLPIAIAVDRGLVLSRDADLIVDLAPEAGIAIKRHRLGRGEAVDPEADAPRFAVPVRGDAAGDHAIAIEVRFWLCGSHVCKPVDVKRHVSVTVTAPPQP